MQQIKIKMGYEACTLEKNNREISIEGEATILTMKARPLSISTTTASPFFFVIEPIFLYLVHFGLSGLNLP